MSKEIIVPEVDREGINPDKLRHFFDVVLRGKTADADAYLESFVDFDVDRLRDLTGKSAENVLLDVDDCLAPPYGPILDKNLGHIDNMKRAGVNFGVYSNCKGMDRLEPLREMDIPIYSGKHAKPSSAGFIEVCKTMGFDPAKTWMVDDNPLTGGGAVGVLEGVAFVKAIGVDPKHVSAKKRVRLFLSGLFRQLAMARTLQGNTKIHRLSAKD
jgi:predicted HAD superfamily phosphohydrolase YqeG